MSKQKKCFSNIGGQAVMEGIMMRNRDRMATAVRKKDGTIAVKEEKTVPFKTKHKWAGWPVIRGSVALIESLIIGMKTLMWSSEQSLDEGDGNEPEKISGGAMTTTVVLAVLIAIGLFVVLPTVLSNFLRRFIDNYFLIALIEGVLRLLIFIGYVLAVSSMKDVRRTFMYHGSEHKCINCLESGLPLTVENVMKSSKEHRRCGTSFLLFVMLISIVLFMFIRIDFLPLRILSRILLIPVVAGLSYELIQFNGKFDNWFTYILSRPGMWMQALTTKEPTADMAEVTIAAVEKVFDWRAFLKDNFDVDVPAAVESNPEE
ncbi:MAG: DUF1385 domain-containing protein [Lachnospiraceae bacterium]|nr:DUF1385 domain-containing protein [Lachnospiraceae bacterium]